MAKKIMILSGSPIRNGNTETMVKWFVEGAKSKDTDIEIISAAHLKYKVSGCISCRRCQKSEKFKCAVNDDATAVIARMPKADMIVMATPMYFFGPTAQLKMIIDRMLSLYKFNDTTHETKTPLKGKRLVLLASAGGDEGLDLLENTFRIIAGFSGMQFDSLIIPNAGVSGDIRKNEDAHKKTVEMGGMLA